MSGGGTQPVVQQTQTRDPWSGAQPYLSSMFSSAEAMRTGNQGFQPYTGQTQAGQNPWLDIGTGALAGMSQSELGGSGPVQAARGLGQSMMASQGINPGLQEILNAMGSGGVAGQYKDIYANQEPANLYRIIASQAQGQQNPYLQAILDTQNRRIGDRINSSFSGAGRYGSGQHTDVMARALAEAEAPVLAQDYEARQQRLGQAAQGLLGVGQQQLAATQGLGSAYGMMGDIYGQGLQRAGQWAQLAPQLDEAQYAGAQRMFGLGEYARGREQAQLNDQIRLYNAQQAYPWEQLQRESAILGGAGQLGGTTVTSAPGASWGQKLLGGGLAGAGLGSSFGPWGAGLGALGGGLAGAFL
jgi:hypothetical protein